MAAFINVFGGLAMIGVDPAPLSNRYWVPIALSMIIGSIFGAFALTWIPNHIFDVVLGSAFFLASLWFIFRTSRARDTLDTAPASASLTDLSIGGISGFCGGFIGINAPVLVLYFGRALDKRHLRRLLVLIFIPAAVTQTVTFVGAGLLNREIIAFGLVMLPSMALGIYLGNKAHLKISELAFRRILGLLLLVISAKLIWGSN